MEVQWQCWFSKGFSIKNYQIFTPIFWVLLFGLLASNAWGIENEPVNPGVELDSTIQFIYELMNEYDREVRENPDNIFSHGKWSRIIQTSLLSSSIAGSIQGVEIWGEFHSFGTNLRYLFPGVEEERILLLIPLPGPGSHNNPATLESMDVYHIHSMAGAIETIKQIHYSNPRYSVEVLFLGAEFEDHKSLRSMLQDPGRLDYEMVIYLANFGRESSWKIENGGAGQISPGWLVEHFIQSMKDNGIVPNISGITNVLHILNLTPGSPISKLLDALQPAIMLGKWPSQREQYQFLSNSQAFQPDYQLPVYDELPGIHTLENRVNALVSSILNPPQGIETNYFQNWEAQYILIQFGEFTWYMGEVAYLSLVFLLLTSVLIWLRLNRRRRKKYIRLISQYWFIIFGLIIGTFLTLLVGGFLPELLLFLRGYDNIWHTSGLLFFVLKITSGLAIMSWLFRILIILVPENSASVFTGIGVFALLIDVLILALFQVTLVYHYLWALVFTVLFAITKDKWIKMCWFLISPFWLIKSLLELFGSENQQLAETLVRINPLTDLLLGFLILPFITMFLRLLILHSESKNDVRARDFFLPALLFILITGTLGGGLYLYNPYELEYQEVDIYIEPAESSYTLRVESKEPLPSTELILPDTRFHTDSIERSVPIPYPLSSEIPRWETEKETFLNRETYTITLSLPEGVESLKLVFLFQGTPIIYDSNFPFLISPEDQSLELFVGDYPGRTLGVTITIPENSAPIFQATARQIFGYPAVSSPYSGIKFFVTQTTTNQGRL